MNTSGAKELTFSHTIDTKVLRDAGIGLSSTYTILPGFCDVHVHFREPGFSYKETIATGSKAMTAKSLGKIITAHCEVNSLLKGGYIHDGKYAAEHGHRGICSESEWRQIERDLKLADETGCAYHVCHISTKESVSIIRDAKKSGVDVTCETGPHYLLLDDSMLQEDGKWKMNPPLRDASDRDALLEGIVDGTIDCIATDHAPHSAEEKSRGLEKSAFGIVGIETAFPLIYTYLVMPGIITMDRLEQLLVYNPRRRFGIPLGNDYSVWDLTEEWTIEKEELLSMGKATPFEGWRVMGRNYLTVCDGKIAYSSMLDL